MDEYIDGFIFTVLVIYGVLFGFILGRRGGDNKTVFYIKENSVDNSSPNEKKKTSRSKSIFEEEDFEKVIIDDKIIVTEIPTTDIQKKFKELGTVNNSEENVSSSANKLKSMKK